MLAAAFHEIASPMSRTPAVTLFALLAALGVVSAALAGTTRGKDDPGVTPKTILLGATAPLTGPMSASASIARGADAYFRYVNAKGGVNGRTITYRVLDDASVPAQTAALTKELVEQEKVFAVFGSVGTDAALAVRSYLNTAKVPQMLLASGATTFGRDYTQYPYTSGFQPTSLAEGWVYGKYLARTAPGAKLAVLFQNDDDGKDILGGLKSGLQRSQSRVIAAQPYDALAAADVSAQMTKLKASGADTLAVFGTPAIADQALTLAAKLGWKPKHVVLNTTAAPAAATVSASSDPGKSKLVAGAISIAYLKNPEDPQWAKDAGMKLYRSIMTRYAPGSGLADVGYVYGMALAWTAVEAIRRAGKDLTRDGVVKALDTFNAGGNPFLLPGVVVKTAGKDHYPVEQMLLQRWQGNAWRSFGGLWAYRRV
jgi:branched-chain amino acid transport system substrate-binding protein